MATNGMLMVDGDGHVMEPDDLWTDRMDADRWGDWIPRKVVEDEIYEIIYVGGEIRGGGRELHGSDGRGGRHDRRASSTTSPRSLRVPGGHEPNARIDDIDVDGIDAAVLYPSHGDVLRAERPDPRAARRRVRRRLHPRVQRLDRRVLRARTRSACSAWPACRCRTSTARSPRAEHACGELGLRGVFVRPSAYVDELPLNHPCTTRSGRRARSSACRSRSTPACTSTRPARAASSGSCASQREHDRHQHGDGRDPRRLRARSGGRQHRRHDRHDGPPAHGRRVRAVPRPAARLPRVGRRVGADACSSAWTSRSRRSRSRSAGCRCCRASTSSGSAT